MPDREAVMPHEPISPPPTLDYAQRPARSFVRGDRVALFAIGLFVGLTGVVLALGTIGIFVNAWPSFGMTLIAVPAEVVACAFVAIGVTSLRAAVA